MRAIASCICWKHTSPNLVAWHKLFLSFLKDQNNLHLHQYHLQPLSPAWYVITTLLSANLTGLKCYHITTLACISLESNLAKSPEFNNRECCSRNRVKQVLRPTLLIERTQNPGLKKKKKSLKNINELARKIQIPRPKKWEKAENPKQLSEQ